MTPAKLFCLIALAVIIVWCLSLPSYPGTYNIITGEIQCINDSTCAHEEGHAKDASFAPHHWMMWEWESAQPEWRAAVDNRVTHCPNDEMEFYRLLCNFPGINGNPRHKTSNPTALYFWTGGWGGYTELYAELYAHGMEVVYE